MTKVSVIVAAYNVEEHIEDTMHSLVNQTLNEAEFIIVDDCSTDKTGDIVKAYSETDNRIKYIRHEENKGTMIARKTGSQAAEGKYIMFLDGDDALDFKACEKAYKAIQQQKTDILQFDTRIFFDTDSTADQISTINSMYSYLESPKMKIVATGKCGLLGNKNSADSINFSIWNKIYKKSLIDAVNKNIPDEKILMAEDLLFSFIVCYMAKSYSYLEEILYNYRFGSGISTAKEISDSRMSSIIQSCHVCKYLQQWLNERECTQTCKKRFDKTRLQIYNNVCYTFITQAPVAKRSYYLQRVLEYISIEEFITALSVVANEHKADLYEKVAEISSELEIFKATKKRN